MCSDPASILIVLHDFSLGGTERIAARLAAAWAKKGARITVFAGSGNGPLGVLAGDDVEVVIADPPIPRAIGSRRRLARAARAFVAKRRFDGVFVPGNFHWPVAAALAKRGVPVVAQVSAALDKPQRGRVRQWAFEMRMRRLLRRVDAIVALSDVARDQANRILRRSLATTIALPALPDDVAPPQPVPDTQPPIVLAAGRLVPEKGFSRLIEAFATLPECAARLVIVGDGPEAEGLRQQIHALGIADRTELAGYVTDIRPWLDAARLLVLASDFEGFPAVVIEALAAGRPVIATDCTPATRLLDTPGAGMVVPLRDGAALASAIETILAQTPANPITLAALVAHHRIGAVAVAYLTLFEGLQG
ncbi:glycosyltransferase [Sphingomonas faeni]|uniref:glycosyltransferase n=1 Tax=Sphingomonas faeni TaxID=185950 RepID=UPI0027890391|nr:glycosyltransferase [Sphingomonas faeni]MDQ0839320.1 glycosyltransferase involved in cell wall biosynthesis [Sphingomonas faeni]